jgi:pSer/pThr/pTyr-binding forkhead associated (FHA) protein
LLVRANTHGFFRAAVHIKKFALSRRHAMVTANGDGTFLVTDLKSTNGTSYGKDNIKLPSGESVTLPAGSLINVAGIELKLLAPE